MERGSYKRNLDQQSNDRIPRTTAYRLKKQKESYKQVLLNMNDRQNLSDTENISSINEYSDRINDHAERISLFPPIEEEVKNDLYGWHQFDCVNSDNEDDGDTVNNTDVWFDAEDNSETLQEDQSINHDKYDDKTTFLFRQKLCKCTSTTSAEAVMMVLLFGAQHSLLRIDFLSMINTVFERNVVPATKHKLLKHLKLPDDAMKYHLYCPECEQYIEEPLNLKITTPLLCTNCEETILKSRISFFLTFNLRSQFQQLLENPETQKILETNRNERNIEVLEDIYDGRVYRTFSTQNELLANSYNSSYTFNSDGCQSSKSNRLTTWPLYVMIHEFSDWKKRK